MRPSQKAFELRRGTRVKVFRQIYGISCNGKEMPPLFRASQGTWKDVAAKDDGIYHCWGPADLETIIKKYFPDV